MFLRWLPIPRVSRPRSCEASRVREIGDAARKRKLDHEAGGLLLFRCHVRVRANSSKDFLQGIGRQLVGLERMWNQAQLSRDSTAIGSMIGDEFINTEYNGEVSDRGKFLADFADPKFGPPP